MNISPRRRRRMMREHQLRQDGRTLAQIAERLDVSIATVHDDLRLLEEHWKLLVKDIHDDLLLQQIARIDQRIERLSRLDPIAETRAALDPDTRLSVDQLMLIEDRHERRLAQAERELRMLLKQLHNPHMIGSTRAGDYPDDELADPATDRTNLKKPETVQTPIPSKTLEIVPPQAAKKIPSHNLKTPLSLPERRPTLSLPTPDAGMSRSHPKSPPLGEMSRSDRGGTPAPEWEPAPPDPELPPDRQAEALDLTDQYQAAQARGDALAQFEALDKLVALYNP